MHYMIIPGNKTILEGRTLIFFARAFALTNGLSISGLKINKYMISITLEFLAGAARTPTFNSSLDYLEGV